MCWPVAIGLALAAGGYVAADAGKQRAIDNQRRVLGAAAKDTAKTQDKNRKLLMGEAQREAPSNVAAEQSGAAGENLAAQTGQANEAVRLFEGGAGSGGAQGQVAGRVLASATPRFAAGAQLAGYGTARNRLAMQADRTNAGIDANNANLNLRLGLVPGRMDVAANSGAGLSALGAGLQMAGNGVMSGYMNQRRPASASPGPVTRNEGAPVEYDDPYAGATDLRYAPNQA